MFPSALLSGRVAGEESTAGYLCVPAKIVRGGDLEGEDEHEC